MDEKILCMPGILCSADKRFSHCLRIAACFELNPKMLNALMRLEASKKYAARTKG